MDLLANLRKGFASITLTALASTFVVAPVQAANLGFTDDAEIPSWADEAIEELMDQGVVSGNDDGSFAPNRQLNRAEVSKIIVLSTGIDLDTTGGPHFPDVSEDAWYYDYIETMYNQGWINGYPDGFFRPGVGINRAEIAKMVVNAFELDQDLAGAPHFDDVTSADWFYGYVETAYNNGLMRGYGDGTFGPANAVTRAETIKIVYDSQLVVIGPSKSAEGTLEMVLSNDTPRGTNIPFNATSVPFTTVELTASDDADVEISSLTFTRLGLGDNDDFDNVWLEIDGFKVGNDKSINNDDVVELRFNPPIVVPAGQTLVADIVASLKYQLASDGTCYSSGAEGCNIGHHNRLALVSAEDIVSTAANIAGDFPIEGEEMEVADYRVSEIKFSRLGSDTTIDVGDSFIEIGKFRMLNSSTTNKDVELRAVTFKNDGTAELEDDLENVSLYVSGEQVSAETIIDGDYVTFRLDNGVTGGYIIEDGDSRIFSIRADIVSAEKGDVINFKVDNFEDVVGVEIGTAFGVKAISGDSNGTSFAGSTTTVETATSCLNEDAEDSCARLRAYAIDAGDLNISRDPASLGNQEYAPGSNDVVVMTARIVVDQPIIVDGVRLNTLEASNSSDDELLNSLEELNAHFDNFRLFLDDKLIDTENQFDGAFGTNGAGTYLDFNTSFEIAGTSVLKLVANLQDGAATGSKLRVEVRSDAFDSPEFISTGDQVTEVQGSAQSSFVEVQESNLIITKTDGLSDNDKIVAGVNDVTFLKFVLDNNDSGDVNATSVSIKAIGTGAATNYSNFTAAVFVDGIQQGSSRSLDKTTGMATFNDLAVVVPSAGQTEFEVVVDTIESSAGANPGVATILKVAPQVTVSSALYSGTGAVAGTTPLQISAGIEVGTTQIKFANTDFENASEIVISDDGTKTGANAEVLTGSMHTDDMTFLLSSPSQTLDSHLAGQIITQTMPTGIDYTATAAGTEYLFSTIANFSAGDQILIDGVAYTIASVNETTKAVKLTSAISTATLTAINTGSAVATEPSTSSLLLAVVAVDADNVENGQSVDVMEAGEALGTNSTDDAGTPSNKNHDCTGNSATNNYLCGVLFDIVKSGTLTIEEGATIVNDSNILLSNAEGIEVFKLRLSAANDEIQVKDLYFTLTDATAADRFDFKLYDDAGALIQSKQATGDSLHFELANQDRIRVPKDDSVTITVKVDVRAITKANQTGKTLELTLATDKGTPITGGALSAGVEAVTAATGSDLEANVDPAKTSISISGTPMSDKFVAYRTMLTFANAASQPTFASTTSEAAIYRFTVTNDVAYEGILNQITVKVSESAPTLLADPEDYKLVKYSSSAYSGTSETIATVTGIDISAGTVLLPNLGNLVFTGFSDEVDGTNYYEVRSVGGYTNSASDNDSITGSLVGDATYVAPATTAAALAAQNIVWSDRSNNGSAGSYLNGFELVLSNTATGVQE